MAADAASFEHVDAFDVGGAEEVEVATAHAVNHHQGRGVVYCAEAADVHLEAVAGLACILYNVHAGGLALESAHSAYGILACDVVAFHL